MNKYLAQTGFLLFLLAAGQPSAWSSDIANVRFDLHRSDNSFVIVGRGVPGMAVTQLRDAVVEKSHALCRSAKLSDNVESEYDYLIGGTEFLMPAGGIFLGRTAPHEIRRAPSLRSAGTCDKSELLNTEATPRPLRVFIRNELGETISYVDQGFASFNRHSLDVRVDGESISARVAIAILNALRQRGYEPEVVISPESSDLEFSVSKSNSPGERFSGINLMTKIGLLGIEKASYAFCSIGVEVRRHSSTSSQALGSKVSTYERIPAVYNDWEKDMTNGPSQDLHAKASELLMKALSADLQAIVHTIPADVFKAAPATGA